MRDVEEAYSKNLAWLRGVRVKIANFLRLHCLAIPIEHKENQTKYRKMTRKPRSHVRILIYRKRASFSGIVTGDAPVSYWPIFSQTSLQKLTRPSFLLLSKRELNPFNPESDQHQISPCNCNAFLLYKTRVMRITGTITQDVLICLIFYRISPHYFYSKWIEATNKNSNFDLRV